MKRTAKFYKGVSRDSINIGKEISDALGLENKAELVVLVDEKEKKLIIQPLEFYGNVATE
jgi:hypothetical protein